MKETLGRGDEGWTRTKAKAELRARLVAVDKEGYVKPEPLTLEAFAQRFLQDHVPSRNLKSSTLIDYELTIRRHLVPALGSHELVELERRPELVERYVVDKLAQGLSPKTIRNQLALLSRMFKVALRWRLVRASPVDMVEPPKASDTEPEVLTEVEVARLVTAYRRLEQDAEEEARAWWCLARRMVTVALGSDLRRGELLALRWEDVSLLDRRLAVRRAWVRNEVTTPKSKTSRRTVELAENGHVLAALQEQWQESRYRSDDDLVFGHPALGTPLDPSKLTREYMKPALAEAGIVKPFRTWHGLRYTAITNNAAVNPQAYVQMRAGHSHGAVTERYIHAAQVAFPGAAERAEGRIFSALGGNPVPNPVPNGAVSEPVEGAERADLQDTGLLPGLDSNQQPSG